MPLACLAAALIVVSGSCGHTPDESTKYQWKIKDVRIVTQDGSCCGGPAAVVLGLLAANDMAMDGNTIKIAAGCRIGSLGSEFGTILELKVRDRVGASEPFENARLDIIDDCDDAMIAGAAGIYELLRQPVSVWRVATTSDDELCGILGGQPDFSPRPLMLRALEEVASRRLNTCLDAVEKLARTAPPEVALRAIGALGRIGDRRAIMTLGRLSLSPYPTIPWAATQAIADIGGIEAIKALEIVAGQSQTETLASEAANLAEKLRKEIH